jgi:autotransporter passenger strand-loop-strand repeat protein
VVSAGGVLQVGLGATASGTQVLSQGADVLAWGAATTGTALSGGYEYNWGRAVGTVIQSGGGEAVEAYGTASRTLISSGGYETVASAGVAFAATISSGGTLLVSSGGALAGGLTIAGGSATIDGTMAAGQTVSFTGASGYLELDNVAGFQAKISGLRMPTQQIDLGGFFAIGTGETAAWSQTGTSGTLTVTDGAQVANLTLIGTYVTSDFTLADDDRGGTLITDPPPSAAPAAVRFAEAMAGFHGGRGVAAIHAGGTALLSVSPLLTAATSGR